MIFKESIKISIYTKPKSINELVFNFNAPKGDVKRACTSLKNEGKIIMKDNVYFRNPIKVKKQIRERKIKFVTRLCEICFNYKSISHDNTICFDCFDKPIKSYKCKKCGNKNNDRYYECKTCKPILDNETHDNDLDYFINDKEEDYND